MQNLLKRRKCQNTNSTVKRRKAESQQKKRKKEKRNKTKLDKHKESKYQKLYQFLCQNKNVNLNVK